MMNRSTLTGVVVSLFVHVLLLFGFYLLRFQLRTEEPSFVSLSFAEVTTPLLPPMPAPTSQPAEQRSADQDIVRLPESRYYRDEAEIPVPNREDSGAERRITEGSVERDVGEKRDLPFTISGEVSKRAILWKQLPRYPRGLQREVTLKFRFFVSPDGSVRDIVPLQKGDPRLERVTIDALSGWKFAPISADSRELQEGVITFIYKLQ
jgi:outer membrane biosynthesis protein TonB